MAIDPEKVKELAESYVAAWNSGEAARVAAHYNEGGELVINRGDPWKGRAGVEEMAAGFFADVPDLSLVCDDLRCTAGNHVLFAWTFTGTHSASGKPLRVRGWEEWNLAPDLTVRRSRGWFDADDYARQAAG